MNRVDICADVSQYESNLGVELSSAGTDCTENFTWTYKTGTDKIDEKFAWVAERPDGTYVLAVGAKEETAAKMHRFIVKLNAATGLCY